MTGLVSGGQPNVKHMPNLLMNSQQNTYNHKNNQKIKIITWNVGTLTGVYHELVDTLV